jgi:serine/threonine-protein kinase
LPAKVSLKIIGGKLLGNEYVFTERTTCIVGRGLDCNPRLPDDEEHRTISRHHCLLDINPPGIRVRDFGSLNGTYVNGAKIGQRCKTASPQEAVQTQFPEYDLKDGDEIKLGSTVFKVISYVPPLCMECSTEIPQDDAARSRVGDGVYRCDKCRTGPEKPDEEIQLTPKPRACSNCGADVSKEAPVKLQGSFLCSRCRSDPMEMVKALIAKANKGDNQLVAIKGYTIIRELGKGGMGAVYLAKKHGSEDLVALKMMISGEVVSERSKAMFMREVENSRHLKHPNVVQLLEFGTSDGTFFFTLEFCDGGSVDRLMVKNKGKLPIALALNIALQALDGLDYAHKLEIPGVKLTDGRVITAKGLVHRDIKPTNLFYLGSEDKPIIKVADFGLGKAFDAAGLSGYTRTGAAAGTPVFMPRQQVINFKYSKPEIDVWAMAASLYFMITGRFPRDFPKDKDPWRLVLQTPAVSILNRDPSIPPRLAAVIDEALLDNPEIKFKSAADFKNALQESTR